MRTLMAGAVLLLAACAQIDTFTPEITGLRASDGIGIDDRTPLALPLRVCEVPTSFTNDQFRGKLPDPVIFAILGSGFMPEVANATSNPEYRQPFVALQGPAIYSNAGGGVRDREHIVFQLQYGDAPLAEGVYSVSVKNPDESESTTARLANAVQIVPPPRATLTTSHVCLQSDVVAVFQGGPFVPGLRVQLSPSQPDLRVNVERPDQVSVTIPAFSGQGPTLPLTFIDPSRCSSTITVPVGCP